MLHWDHNAYYHGALLRRLPKHVGRVLDVGCGAGHLAARLAERADHVDALDIDAQMVKAAQALVPNNVTCWQADIMEDRLRPASYDAIVSLSALHHLDLQAALIRCANALRPGGVIIAIALPKVELPRELPVELAAVVVHHLLGIALASTRHRWRTGLPHPVHPGSMPMKDPVMTTRQVRDSASAVLPSAEVRRLLLWRYLLTWRKPISGTSTTPGD